MADVDREQLDQYAPQTIALQITVGGTPTDADGNTVTVVITNEDTTAELWSGAAMHLGTGQYGVPLSIDQTDVAGNYQVQWVYALSSTSHTTLSYFALGGATPLYDNLSDDYKSVVDNVWARFADLFDSASGGPNLQSYFQSNWGRGRVAQCLNWALDRINTAAQPYSQYSSDAFSSTGPAFPVAQWGGLLRQATYVEALKHLRRSYVEQPDFQGATISRLDRRDYMQRWGEVLADEEALLRPQIDVFKIKQMGLGRPSILVSGGVFGRYSPVNMPGMAGRPRFYNAAF